MPVHWMDDMLLSAMPESQAPPFQAATAQVTFEHHPVLLDEVLAFAPPQAGLLADVTLGGGGHAAALLEKFPQAELFGCDRDPAAVAAAGVRLAPFASRVLLKQLEFSQVHAH